MMTTLSVGFLWRKGLSHSSKAPDTKLLSSCCTEQPDAQRDPWLHEGSPRPAGTLRLIHAVRICVRILGREVRVSPVWDGRDPPREVRISLGRTPQDHFVSRA